MAQRVEPGSIAGCVRTVSGSSCWTIDASAVIYVMISQVVVGELSEVKGYYQSSVGFVF